MGKVTTYCQISGCSPEIEYMFEHDYLHMYLSEDDIGNASELEIRNYWKVREALKLLVTEDETRGTQALSIIGPFDSDNKPIWRFEENPHRLDDILEEAADYVRELPGCRMGDCFAMGYCDGPTGHDDGAIISHGPYFFIQSNMLAILEAATQGRISVQRLWRLVMMKGHYRANSANSLIPGVDYGHVRSYIREVPWYFGEVNEEELPKLGNLCTTTEVAEVLRKKGVWMWMRPDRFPIDPEVTPRSITDITEEDLRESIAHGVISKLPAKVFQLIALELHVREIVTLATLNKMFYCRLLGDQETRDSLAKAYIYKYAFWCLPMGQSELKWWKEKRGDDALGWDYLRKCWGEDYSMKNRERIWTAAESIEEECERIGA